LYQMPGKERKIQGEIALIYSVAALVFLLDQVSKYLVRTTFQQGSSIPVIDNLFHITLVYNTGAAFGMLKAWPYLFVAVSILAVAIVNYILLKKRHVLRTWEKAALCFIMAGTLGNLADRIRLGCVVDFIDLRVWPVFNVADSFITIGAVMLGWSVVMGIRRRDV
jgi:signal peptidase II